MESTEIAFDYQLNNTYLKIGTQIENEKEDYRYKMLAEYKIDGILPMQINSVNGKKEALFDVSEKQSLKALFANRTASRQDVKELFEAIMLITEILSGYLIEEGNVYLLPELIFKDIRTGKYEFVCLPNEATIQKRRENLMALLDFLLEHCDTGDEKLADLVFEAYNCADSANVSYSTLYKLLIDRLRDREIPVETYENTDEKEEFPGETPQGRNPRFYIPSFKEVIAFAMCFTGVCLIGYDIYMRMLP